MTPGIKATVYTIIAVAIVALIVLGFCTLVGALGAPWGTVLGMIVCGAFAGYVLVGLWRSFRNMFTEGNKWKR